MKTRIAVALSLILSMWVTVCTAAQPIDGPSDVKVVSHLPVVLPQKRTSWCYAFAARSLFSQYSCAKTGQCLNADQVAVTNFISAFNTATTDIISSINMDGFKSMMSWWGGGDSAVALRQMTTTQVPVASRQCTAEENVYAVGDLAPFALGYMIKEVGAKFYETRAQTPGLKAKDYFVKVVNDPKLLPILKWMEPALDATNDFDTFTTMSLLPPACLNNKLALAKTPRFNVREDKITDVSALKTKVQSIIDSGVMVGISICAGVLDPDLKECGNHATAIAGYRTFCTKGKCEKQFLFYDSSFFLSENKNPDGSYWVSADLIARAAIELANGTDASSKKVRIENEKNMRKAIEEAAQGRTKLLQEYTAGMKKAADDVERARQEQLKLIRTNPELDQANRAKLEKYVEELFASTLANLKPVPDLSSLDEAIVKMQKTMEQTSAFSAAIMNANNLFWLEP